ncbi:class I SAM-dependent DNA methyltransferase [Actinomadura rupiterrae]|uniref:class I SAM-dependent DNA methyltransferase n=1 Tax=Actinomadura rupiterrae TaxID=559627 RepID=UPI0020A332BC|nr:class I SAM-dependent methyltransferase [Actinomadura rupiterrae]MCP2336216.1 SAM-dependent methyltransferase [Actinomadura rupiterrae]
MPTLPSGTPRQPHPFEGREAHQAREMAESFGASAERYDRARPGYPDALITRIVAAASRAGGAGPVVLDVGCGTGIASRQFQAAGCEVLGVDVDERMVAFARSRGLDAEVAKFEEWDASGRTFDAVVSATTWHWLEPDSAAAKAAMILRPDGVLAAFWHIFAPEPAAAEAFDAVYARVLPELQILNRPQAAASGHSAIVDKASDGIRATSAFTEPEIWTYEWTRTYTRDEWLDHVPTTGVAPRIPEPKMNELLDALGDAVDTLGGSFTMNFTTHALTAVRLPSS